jgi:hypothetical protein
VQLALADEDCATTSRCYRIKDGPRRIMIATAVVCDPRDHLRTAIVPGLPSWSAGVLFFAASASSPLTYRGPFAPARRLDATSGQRPRHATKRLNTAGLYLVRRNERQIARQAI